MFVKIIKSKDINCRCILTLKPDVMEFKCSECGHIITYPIRTEYIDYKQAVEDMKQAFDMMQVEQDRAVQELIDMFPGVPIREFIDGKKRDSVNRINRVLETLKGKS